MCVVIALAAGFVAFVWPTLYQPLSIDLSGWPRAEGPNHFEFVPLTARQNRVTGEIDFLLFPVGWVQAGGSFSSEPTPRGDLLDSLAELARKHPRK